MNYLQLRHPYVIKSINEFQFHFENCILNYNIGTGIMRIALHSMKSRTLILSFCYVLCMSIQYIITSTQKEKQSLGYTRISCKTSSTLFREPPSSPNVINLLRRSKFAEQCSLGIHAVSWTSRIVQVDAKTPSNECRGSS